MERQILESTDMDIRQHLCQLATDCNMFVLACNVQHCENPELLPHFVDAIESRMEGLAGAYQI